MFLESFRLLGTDLSVFFEQPYFNLRSALNNQGRFT